MSRPPAIVLDDLRHPRFSGEAAAVLDMMSEMGQSASLSPDELLGAARESTGLDDFGSGEFRARLDQLCRSLRDEARLTSAGVLAQSQFIIGLLSNRLLLERLIKDHPEIEEERIIAPIIICGLPRTGTTHLHNLMSADHSFRSLPYWESLEPVLADRERPLAGEPDPRLARTEMAVSFINSAMPEFKRMHEMTVEHVHEEIQLLAIDFSTMLFETIAPMPTWRDAYLSRDQRPSYAYLKKILQALQWLRGGTRWVLKSPQHLEQFPAIADVFPDATFVVTHRDPVTVTASMVTMVGYSARLGHDVVDLAWIGGYWSDRLERMLRACVEQRELLPAGQSIDVHFQEFMADDMAMVRRIYALADQPMTTEAESAMTRFIEANPRGRNGAVIYELDQFGLDADQLRQTFAFYTERFGVATE